ncbi:MAG: recombinase family protein [Dehalococcoidia bacterium]|nr:recombinase family protein [Dehalococcoidia bacterium]
MKANRRERQTVRKVGLVVRVSTDMQAASPEGSLVTQLQRLRQQVAYKRDAIGEPWEEAAVYELRGVSGKDSVRSPGPRDCSRTSARAGEHHHLHGAEPALPEPS